MKIRYTVLALCLATAGAIAAEHPAAGQRPARPVFEPNGTVHVPAFDLPPSPYLSEGALKQQQQRVLMPSMTSAPGDISIEERRAGLEKGLAPKVKGMLEAYPVDVVEDVAAVYKALLQTYQPNHIGIYGGSAGGALSAQTAAWLF